MLHDGLVQPGPAQPGTVLSQERFECGQGRAADVEGVATAMDDHA
jgi:hypothetical protein